MTDPRASAERLVRRFARETNLLVAGRAFAVRGTDAAADELRRLLPALGARVIDAANGFAFAPGAHEEILQDGAPLPARSTPSERVDNAGRHMPVSTLVAARLREQGTVRGIRIGVAMVLEPKTAQLALLLADAGADVAVYAHPDEIDTTVASVLRERGIPVDGDPSLSGAEERAAAVAFLSRGFDLLLDDGSHLIRLAAEEGIALKGAAEETTSGLAPLRLMEEQGLPGIPVIAVNDAAMKTSFDNRYGTGQSCVFAIADVLDGAGIGLRDQPAVVIGYGPVGEGVAAHLRAFGAEISVAETDPVRALRVAHDGFRIGTLRELAPGALVVSATGAPHTVDADTLAVARIVAVAGGVPGEVDLPEATPTPVAPYLDRVGDGALLIAGGGCVNLAAAEGNPIEIMDLSFAVQLSAVEQLLTRDLPAGLHPLPAEADDAIARAALEARGDKIDRRSTAQAEAQADWRSRRYRTASA